MENGPEADFEVHFYDGWRMRYIACHSRLEVIEPVQHDANPPAVHRFPLQDAPLALSPVMAEKFRHTRLCLQRCLHTERQSSNFPVVIRSHRILAGTTDYTASATPASDSPNYPIQTAR